MSGPKAPALTLNDAERRCLEEVVQDAGMPPQLVRRAQIILCAAAGANNRQIAQRLGLDLESVRMWRRRWLGQQNIPQVERSVLDRLRDAPRPGRPPRLTQDQIRQVVELARAAPGLDGTAQTQWGVRRLARAAQDQGIMISPRHVWSLLKK